MSTQSEIREAIDRFAGDLEALVRQAAVEAVSDALGQTFAQVSHGTSRGRLSTLPKQPGQKRTPEELDQLTEQLERYIRKHPGRSIEAIAEGLGTRSKELSLPIKKLLASAEIKKKGQKRATKYFPR